MSTGLGPAGGVRALAAADVGALTYSSFDRGDGVGGGWQVKESAGLDAGEAELLRSRVQTSVELAVPLPAFPTPDDVARLPRKLVHTPLDTERGPAAAYWHTVPAGTDGSGRPGNVFAHVLLDRAPARGTVRPIELWRSPDWLTPFGPEQVVAAQLGGAVGPGAAASREAVLDFLLDPDHWRTGVLSVLLDAVAAALAGGARVVLGTATADEAALWIGAVSHLASPGTCLRLGFSTYERAATLATSWARGVVLACVPTTDLARVVVDDEVVVLDAAEDPSLGDHGGEPHATAAGSVVVVTPWSVVAAVALQDRGTAELALTMADRAVGAVADEGLAPAWPLAAAVALAPEALADATAEAGLVLAESSPPDLAGDADLFAAASRLVRAVAGEDTRSAWAALAGARTSSGELAVGQDLLLQVYLERALADPAWLAAPPAPLPAGYAPARPPAASSLELAAAVVHGLREQAQAGGDDEQDPLAARVLAALDLLGRARVLGAVDPAVADAAAEVVERVVVPLLLDPHRGPALVARAGPVGEELLAGVVRPCVATHPALAGGVLGARVVGPVLDWLYPAPPAVPPVRRLLDAPAPADDLLAELGARICLRPGAHRYAAVLRPVVLWKLLLESSRGAPRLPAADPLFTEPWPCDDLASLLHAFGDRVPPRLLAPSLLADPGTPALRYLLERLQHADPVPPTLGPWLLSDDDPGYAAAALRDLLLRGDAWRTGGDAARVRDDARHLVACAATALAGAPARAVHPAVAEEALVASCLDAAARPGADDGAGLLPVLERAVAAGAGERAVPAVVAAVRAGVLTGHQLVAAALVGAPGAPTSSLSTSRVGLLGGLRFRAGDYDLSVLEYAASSWFLASDSRAQADVTDAALDDVWAAISGDPGAEQVSLDLEKFVKRWWPSIGVHGGVRSRLRGR